MHTPRKLLTHSTTMAPIGADRHAAYENAVVVDAGGHSFKAGLAAAFPASAEPRVVRSSWRQSGAASERRRNAFCSPPLCTPRPAHLCLLPHAHRPARVDCTPQSPVRA